MYDTFFYISIESGKDRVLFGPYLSFSEAATLFFDYGDFLIRDLEFKTTTYKISIVEYLINNNSIDSLLTKIEETRHI